MREEMPMSGIEEWAERCLGTWPQLQANYKDALTKAREQKHRADVLAATIRELSDVVTHDAETKADFIARVRNILSADPDDRAVRNLKNEGLAQQVPLD
jgi:DNA repair ATPase RecN